MAGFSDFPPETVSRIRVSLQDPHAIESFALVSTNIHALGRAHIGEYRRLRARFLRLESFPGAEEGGGLAAYLKHFILNPVHALYVKEARLGGLRMTWGYHTHRRKRELNVNKLPRFHQPPCKSDMRLFRRAIRGCEWITNEQAGEWVEAVKIGDEEPIFILLVMKLCNIGKLELLLYRVYNRTAKRFCRVLKGIVGASYQTYLSQLKEIVIDENGRDSASAEGGKISSFIRGLPSVTLLQCLRFQSDIARDECHERSLLRLNPGLEHLSFVSCLLNDRILSESLIWPKALKSFTCNNNICYMNFDFFFIRASLLAHAGRSLETLEVSVPWATEVTYMGSIREFNALKRAITDYTSLLGMKGFKDPITSALADVLPDSIEEFGPQR